MCAAKAKETKNETNPKSPQWSFVATPSHINPMSSKLPKGISCLTFTEARDDTDRKCVQGFIKSAQPVSVDHLRTSTGPAIFAVVVCIPDILVNILMGDGSEFGHVPKQHQRLCDSMKSFKTECHSTEMTFDCVKWKCPKLVAKCSVCVVRMLSEKVGNTHVPKVPAGSSH